MRRNTQLMRALWGGTLLALLVAGVSRDSFAQDVAKEVNVLGKGLIVPLNQTIRLQLASKKPISKVATNKENVVGIRTIPGDPTTILLTGQNPDIAQLTLTDEDGKQEKYEITVQLDVEYFKAQVRRVIPSANITPIPFGNNGVILTGTVSRAEDIDVVLKVTQSIGGLQIVNALKVAGVQQVQLDVVIAQVTRSEFRALAFNFLADSPTTFIGSTVGNAVSQPISTGVGSVFGAFPLLTGNPGTPNGQGTNILFGVVNSQHGFLGFLQALRVEGVSKTLAQPSLTTMSGTAGSFLVGGEQAVPVPAGLGQVGVQFEEFGTRLNYLPIVLGNGKIHLEIEPEVSSLSQANGTTIQGTTVPGRDTNRTHATVELESGQTFIISGLIQHDVQATASKVPVLGDLPFIGAAFSSKSTTETEREVIVLITPHLVDAQDCHQVTKCLPGQESRTADDFELFLENILEAPRGPREVFQDHHYIPAFKNGPTSEIFPCAGAHGRGGPVAPSSGVQGCGQQGCGQQGSVVAPVTQPVPAQTRAPELEPMTNPAAAPAAVPVNFEPQSVPATVPPMNGQE